MKGIALSNRALLPLASAALVAGMMMPGNNPVIAAGMPQLAKHPATVAVSASISATADATTAMSEWPAVPVPTSTGVPNVAAKHAAGRYVTMRALEGTSARPACKLAIDHFDRFSECAEAPWIMDVINQEGHLVGSATGVTFIMDTLAFNSRTWNERIKVAIATVTGQADGTIFDAPIACIVVKGRRCQPTGRGSWAGQDTLLAAEPGVIYSGNLWFTSSRPDTTFLVFEVNMDFRPPDSTPVMILIGSTETIRCDSEAIFRPTTGGCVYLNAVKNILELSVKNSYVTEAARFIRRAQHALPHHPGVFPKGTALTRLTNRSAIRRNRRVACRGVKLRKGQSCDEYPFASTHQGAALAGHGHFKAKALSSAQNSKVGTILNVFFLHERIADGDPFYVSILG